MACCTVVHSSSPSCSTWPGAGKCCGTGTVARPSTWARVSSTSAVVPVVP